jgi:hypothetical protein
MKFDSEDNGNCRVYYQQGRKLFCWQDDGSWGKHAWKFYACSSDGEPSYGVKPPANTPLPPGESAIGRELIAFLSSPR